MRKDAYAGGAKDSVCGQGSASESESSGVSKDRREVRALPKVDGAQLLSVRLTSAHSQTTSNLNACT